MSENIERLLLQKDGDPSCFYLAIFSFIEGYLRSRDLEKYKFTYDAGEKFSLATLFKDLLDEVDPAYKSNILRLKDYACNDTHIEKWNEDGSKEWKKHISANEVRHTFCKQENETICDVVKQFIKFAKNFGFLTDEINNLQKIRIFDYHRDHKISPDTLELINENKTLQEKICSLESTYTEEKKANADAILKLQKEKSDLLDKLDESQDSSTSPDEIKNLNEKIKLLEKQISEKVSSDQEITEYLSAKSQLSENQSLLTMWSKSWRDYNEQMFNLTEEQIQILEDIKTDIKNDIHSNYLIQGGPGTGKTIILIHLLKEFINTDIQLLTYTSSLNKYNKSVASKLFKEDAILEKIKTFDHFLQDKAEKILKKEIYIPNQDGFTDIYSKQLKKKIDILRQNNKYQYLTKTASYILNEAINEIWSLLPDETNYITMYYCTGKKITNSNELAERQLIWNLVKELESVLEGEKVIPLEYACYKLTLYDTNIDNNHKNNYVLVDEIQDLSKAKIKAISKLIKKNYVISGDLSQSVFIRKALSWSQVASFVKETREVVNEKALKKNFRSSASIQELANTFLDNVIIKDKNIYSEGFMPGPTPDYTISDNQEDSLEDIKKRIKLLKEKLYFSNKDFCIIASNKDELKEIKTILGEDFPSKEMEDDDFKFDDNDDSIRLSTVKFIKGIDCPVVLLYLSNNYLEKETNGNMDKNTQMNGLYACITRAMNILSIFINNSGRVLDSDNSISKLYKSLEIIGIKN